MADAAEQAPAGWYNDPHAPERMRYFDGAAWTNHFHEPGRLPEIGNWLNTTFAAIGSHWLGASVIAFGTTLLGNVVFWFAVSGTMRDVEVVDESMRNFGSSKAVVLVLLVAFSLIWQGFSWIALNRYMHRAHFQANPRIGEAFAHAAARVPRYLGILLALILFALVVMAIVSVLIIISPALGIMALLGLLVAAVWVGVKLWFVMPAITAAPPGTAVLPISAGVSTGRFLSVLGRIALLTLVPLAIGSVVSAIIGDPMAAIDTEALSANFTVDGDEFDVSDFRVGDLLPSSGALLLALVLSSALRAASSLVSSSGFMRLYLDSGAPSDL